MAQLPTLQESANDLWARAAKQLPDDDRRGINFSQPKLYILDELKRTVEHSKQKLLDSRKKFTRKNGQVVIIREVYAKITRCINVFKQVGDIAVQYDPAHAALPWAAIRLVLQVAINDDLKFVSVVEGLAQIAELLCHCASIEELYLQEKTKKADDLERTLVKLYAIVLNYLSNAKHYFERSTTKRFLTSASTVETRVDSDLDEIRKTQIDVDRHISLIDRDDRVRWNVKMTESLAQINAPLQIFNDKLKDIHDGLEVEKRAKIVEWLSSEPYAKYHLAAADNVLEGTGQWLLSDHIFREWKNDAASSILWLHGIPGSGKTKLVSIVIQDAIKSYETGTSLRPVYFYCSRNPGEPGRSDAKAILASLASQLSYLKRGMPLLKPAVDSFRKWEEIEGIESLKTVRQSEIIPLIILLINEYPRMTIVIDALDECDSRSILLNTFEEILQKSSSLVKIFVSSRDDLDIVLKLENYPNLQIDSQRNGVDIARFVKTQTEDLVRDNCLLMCSDDRTAMQELIIKKVINGASGMFRWASMQLEYLCLLRMDADIKDSLDQSPPSLHDLYETLYDKLSTSPGDTERLIFKNILHWLLCARGLMPERDFLHAVSLIPQLGEKAGTITKNHVLKICSNFVVFDSTMRIFRFAHLSVREFLEKRPEHNKSATNSAVAEVCLWSLLSMYQHQATEGLFSQLGWHAITSSMHSRNLRIYVDVSWATHCILAGPQRDSSNLKLALQLFMTERDGLTSSIALWVNRIDEIRRMPMGRFRIEAEILRSSEHRPLLLRNSDLSLVDGFVHLIQDLVGEGWFVNRSHAAIRVSLQFTARSENCTTFQILLRQLACDVAVGVEVVVAAVANTRKGPDLMTLLFDRQGADVPITGKVVEEAAGNQQCGREVLTLLLERRGVDLPVTKDAVKAAASNEQSGMEILTLLFERRGVDLPVTKDAVKAAASNEQSGMEILTLLFERRGVDLPVTKDAVKAAASNKQSGMEILTLLFERRGVDLPITEKVIEAALYNRRSSQELLLLILKRREGDLIITENVLMEAVAQKSSKEVWLLLLEQKGADLAITEKVLMEAASRGSNAEIWRLLLDRQQADIAITEKIVDAAAQNRETGKEVLRSLLFLREVELEGVLRNMTGESRDVRFEILSPTMSRLDFGDHGWIYKGVRKGWYL